MRMEEAGVVRESMAILRRKQAASISNQASGQFVL
jgi:hypothetical protein